MSEHVCTRVTLETDMSPAKGGDSWDGTDMQWEIVCYDCDKVIAEGDGYSNPELVYQNWAREQRKVKR